jgi:hypothetical protein
MPKKMSFEDQLEYHGITKSDVAQARDHYIREAEKLSFFYRPDRRFEFPFDCLLLFLNGKNIDQIIYEMRSNRNCVSQGFRIALMRTLFWRAETNGTSRQSEG